MIQKIKTLPDMSQSSPEHVAAIIDKKDHLISWTRNVVDKFKDKTSEEIKTKLKETSFPYAVLFENWVNDFNLASGFRNANAFNAKEVFYVGNKKFDKRGTCGVHNYFDIQFVPTVEDIIKLKSKYKFVAVDNMPGAIPLDDYSWSPNTLMVFGSEGVGITQEMRELCEEMVYIPQFGSVRSVNCATASGIIMNSFVSQYRKNN